MSSDLITACIVHYRKLHQLKRTVADLLANTYYPIKIKILNQGFIDNDIKTYLEEISRHPKIEVIYNKTNTGCSPGRNQLTKQIDTPFVLILDDDIYVNKDWDKPVIEQFNRDSNTGAVGFVVYRADGSFWHICGRNLGLNEKNKTINPVRPPETPVNCEADFIKVDDVCAGAIIYRTELHLDWDDNYFIGFEDLDKALQLVERRIGVYVSMKSKFIHDKVSLAVSNKHYNKSRRDYHAYRRSYLHFVQKKGYSYSWPRHFFYKYVCLLPKSWLTYLVLGFLKIKKTSQ